MFFILADIYLFKINNRNTRKVCEICSRLTAETPGPILLKLLTQFLCLLSTLNIFHNLFLFLLLTLIGKYLLRLFLSVFYFSGILVERKKHVIYNILSIHLKIFFHVNLTTYSNRKKRQFKQDLPIIFTVGIWEQSCELTEYKRMQKGVP